MRLNISILCFAHLCPLSALLCSATLLHAFNSSFVVSNYQSTIVIKGIKHRILKRLQQQRK